MKFVNFFLKIMPKLSIRAIWELINICIVSFGHTFMLNFYDSIPARRTGYICGDPWLSLPYKGYPPLLHEELMLVIELSMFAIVSNFNTSEVQGKNNEYHNVNKGQNSFIDTLIFDLIDNVVFVVFALYSSLLINRHSNEISS